MRPQHTIIVGAGPGGLVLARSLQLRGLPFTVLEKRLPGAGIADVGRHGSRGNLAFVNPETNDIFHAIGLNASRYSGIVAIGRLERDLLELIRRDGGSIQFGARVASVRPVPGAGVRAGVVDVHDAPVATVEGSELANFSGGRIGVEEALGMQLRPVGDPHIFASGYWPEPGLGEASMVPLNFPSHKGAPAVMGYSTSLDGAHLVMSLDEVGVESSWRELLDLQARHTGIRGARAGAAQVFRARDEIADIAHIDNVLGGGESLARHAFRFSKGMNLAAQDADDMARAIEFASRTDSPLLRSAIFDHYAGVAMPRHRELTDKARAGRTPSTKQEA